MPTGYTSYIEDGDITTGKEFLKLCTRAFGIAIELKDEPLSVPTPTHFEPDLYYKSRYERALQNLDKAKKITFEEAKNKMKLSYEKRISDYKSFAENAISLSRKYEKVRKEVEDWIPPTDNHKNLKKFALDQIDMSITNQGYIDEYLEISKEEFDSSDEAVYKYIEENINFCSKEVDMAYKAWQEELQRTKEKNEWITKFYESLG